ncbi:MAG TPA: MFS transporter [Steroidobacteraceae bacterium]|jgi:MFS family permease|nr:MFS transporter [Steroidobacteraceae bacterium]
MSPPSSIAAAAAGSTAPAGINAPAGGTAPAYPSAFAAWYSVAVLMLMYVFSFIDRTTISLIVEPMKRDLHISDTEIGMLQGFAFALLYTFLGLPIARLSDRHNRRAIIAGGVFIWSIMATSCGLARTAIQLFIARIGVGVGEAALSPAAYSIITDSFPRSRLGGAFGVYNIGITIGAGIAFLVGGIVVAAVSHAGASYTLPLLGEVRAWQMVFIVTGAPGILLPLLLLTFREPARRGLLRTGAGSTPAAPLRPPLSEVLGYVWANRKFYALHFVALALLSMCGYCVAAWLPTAIIRAYGVGYGQVGKVLGVSTVLMNSTGMLLAGILCDRLTRAGSKDAPIVVALISACGIAVFASLPTLMPTVTLVWVAIFISGLTFNAYNGVGPMAVNQVTPNQYRAQVSSVYLFVVNVLGLGVGPTLVPLLNEHLFHDPLKIRYSLIMVVFCAAVTAVVLLLIVRPIYRQKLLEASQWQ